MRRRTKMGIKITASTEQQFRLQDCSEDDTMKFNQILVYLRICEPPCANGVAISFFNLKSRFPLPFHLHIPHIEDI